MGKHTAVIEQQIINQEVLDFNESFIIRSIEERKMMPFRSQSAIMFHGYASDFQSTDQTNQETQSDSFKTAQHIKKLIILYKKLVQKQYFESLYIMVILQSIFFFTYFLQCYHLASYWFALLGIIFKVELMHRHISSQNYSLFNIRKEEQYQKLYESISTDVDDQQQQQSQSQTQSFDRFIMKNQQTDNFAQAYSYFLNSYFFKLFIKYFIKRIQLTEEKQQEEKYQERIECFLIIGCSFLDSLIFFLIIAMIMQLEELFMLGWKQQK